MKKNDIRYLTTAAAAAAMYAVLTLLSASAGLASGPVQLRLSEALCVLPAFTPAAVPGLAAGCLIANLLTGCLPWDIVFGTAATLIGAYGTRLLRRHKYIRLLPPVISNTLIVPAVLVKVYGITAAYPLVTLGVFAGEAISVCVFGSLLYPFLSKTSIFNGGR